MDKSVVVLDGIIDDIMVKVDKFFVPADFIVFDIEEDKEVPLILERSFLVTGDAMIGARTKDVTFKVDGEIVQVDVEEMKTLAVEKADSFCMDVIKLAALEATQKCAAVKMVEKKEVEIQSTEPYEGPTWDDIEPGFKFAKK